MYAGARGTGYGVRCTGFDPPSPETKNPADSCWRAQLSFIARTMATWLSSHGPRRRTCFTHGGAQLWMPIGSLMYTTISFVGIGGGDFSKHDATKVQRRLPDAGSHCHLSGPGRHLPQPVSSRMTELRARSSWSGVRTCYVRSLGTINLPDCDVGAPGMRCME